MLTRVIEKASGVERVQKEGAKLHAERASVFLIKVAPEKVASFLRQGNDLVLVLKDGQKIVITDFFVRHVPPAQSDENAHVDHNGHNPAALQGDDDADYRSELVLEDGNGVYWWGQYPREWSEFHFAEIETGQTPVGASAAWVLPVILGVVGAGGTVALVGGGGKGSKPGPNAPPVAADDTGSGNEDGGPITGNVLSNDRDPEGDTLSVTTFTVAGDTTTHNAGSTVIIRGVGTFTLTSDGKYTFTPDANWNGTVPAVTYTVRDGQGGTDTAKLILTVNPVSDLTAADDGARTNENRPVTGTVAGNDRTTSGGTLTFTKASDPAHGTVIVNSDGTYTYTPADGFSGQDSFTYTVTDPLSGESLARTVTVTVEAAAEPTMLAPDRAITPEDTSLSGNVLTNDTATDGGTLAVIQFTVGGQGYAAGATATIPGVGTILIGSDGRYTFTPVADWNGTVPTVTYTATDGKEPGTYSSTLDIVVTPVVDITPDVATSEGNQPVTIPVLNNDTFENDDAAITSTTNGAHGTVTVNPDGTITYTQNPGYAGPDTFTYTVTSGGVTETTTVTINSTYTVPGPQADSAVTPEDTPVSGNVLTNDTASGGRTLEVTQFTVGGQTYAAGATATIPGVGTIVVGADGGYTFTPVPDWNGGAPQIVYTATDGNSGGSVTSTLDIVVTPVVDLTPDVATVHAGQSVTTPVLTNDTFENANAAVTGATNGANGSVTVNPDGTITYTPNPGYVGPDTYTYIVTSGGVTETTTVTINVTNRPPQADPDRNTTREDTPVSGNVLTNDRDPDGDPVTVTQFEVGGTKYAAGTSATIAGFGTIVIRTDGTYTFTPARDWNGTVPTITYTVSDGNAGGTATSTLDISVTPVNDPPVSATTLSPQANEDADQVVSVNIRRGFTDVDGDTLKYSQTGLPDGLVLNPDTGIISGPINRSASQGGPNGDGVYTVTVMATDPDGEKAEQTFTWRVTNPAPIAQDDSNSTDEVTALNVTAANGVIRSGGASSGEDIDPDGDDIAVTQVNGNAANLGAAIEGSSGGRFTLNGDGSYSFDPDGDFENLAVGETRETSVTYTISDGEGGADTATLTITVTGVNDAPVTVGTVPDQADEDDDGIVSVGTASAFTDIDGDALIYSISGQPAGLSINASTGVIRGNIDNSASQGGPGNNGVYTVTVTVSDGHGGTVDQVFTWTVTNPAPIAQPDNGSVDEDGASLVVTAANGVIQSAGDDGGVDSDPDGDDLHVTRFATEGGVLPAIGNAGGNVIGKYGTLTLNADGGYTYVVDNQNADVNALKDGDELQDTFTYEISDGEGGIATTTLTITINGHTDALPTIAANDGNGAAVGHATVYESALTDDDPDGHSERATGTISITAGDGLSSVTIGGTGGTTLTLAQLEALSPTTTVTIDTPLGRLLLTGYASTSELGGVSTGGNLSYEYVLEKVASTSPSGPDTITETIPLSVTDVGGDSNTGSLIIGIVDDIPSFRTIESVTHYENDLANGTSPNLAALVQTGDIGVRTGADLTGFDVKLVATQTAPAALTAGGQAVTYSIGANGHTLTASAGGTTVFTLTLVDPTTATPEYRFELFRPLDNHGGTDLSFAITAIDGDGDTATGSIGVTIIDDVPFGVNEASISLPEGGATVGTADGDANLLANEVAGDREGADQDLKITQIAYTNEGGTAATAIVPEGGQVTVDTQFGSLTVYSNGDWSYTSDATENNASGVSDSFTYTMEDGDGSTATATQPLTVIDTDPAAGTVSLTLREAHIPVTGSDAQAANTTEQNIVITKSADAIADVTFDSATISGLEGQGLTSNGVDLTFAVSGGGHTLTASAGSKTIFTLEIVNGTDASGTSQKVVMSLVGSLDHAAASGANTLAIPVSYTISDSDSDVSASMTLTVVDDLPVAVQDTSPVSVVEGGQTTSGNNLLANDNEGADVAGAYVYQVRYIDEGGVQQTGTIAAGSSGSTFDTQYGSLTVRRDGTWSYTSDAVVSSGASVNHDKPVHDTDIDDVFQYNIIDVDGDVSNWASQAVTVKDTTPTIGTPASSSLKEANLPLGSDPDGPALIQTGSLAVTKGADGMDTTFASVQTALEALNLTSRGTALVYTVGDNGHLLTASAGGVTVFTVTIENPTTSSASYSVSLSGVLDHDAALSIDLLFAYQVVDGDGDSVATTFTVTVVDDQSAGTQSVSTSEDQNVTFNTNADAIGGNTSIGAGSDAPAHGDATVNPNGTITYVPDADYSGTDTFTYTTVADDGSSITTTVTIAIAPVSDAPTVTFDSAAITTPEDIAVLLGLNLPVITDETDQNGATTGDDPERLGLVELTGIPAGATLNYGSGFYTVSGTVGSIPAAAVTILISDVPHPTGLPAATLTMTRVEYETMTVLPVPESHVNFTVTVKATSYEVDGAGAQVTGVPGAVTTSSMTVGVLAVTDPMGLELRDSLAATDPDTLADHHTINEGGSVDLKTLLTVSYPNSDGNTTADVDNSELRWFEIAGLPGGFAVNGTTISTAGQIVTVSAPGLGAGSTSLPDMIVTPPADYSGDATVTITLKAQDRDGDNPSLVTTVEQAAVVLNLHVNPVAGDVTASNVSTPEDTSVAFLAGLRVTDTSTSATAGGSEIIDKVVFDVPTGWVVTAPAGLGFTASLSGGTYTIDFTAGSLTEAQRETVLDGFSILPPPHLSADRTIAVTVTTTDTALVNGATVTSTVDTGLSISVMVTPVAERVGSDTAAPASSDVTMAGSHTYFGIATEDEWFALGAINDGYALANGWSDEDSDEQLFAQITPVLTGGAPGDTVIGTQFEYGGTTVTYTGTPLNIPVAQLGTLSVKLPADVSGGTVTITMSAYTIDTDPDTGATVNAVSGMSILTLPTFAGAADPVTLSLNARVIGLEDTANPLRIRPTSSDPTETFNVTISNIPAGSTLVYNGTPLTISGGSVTITNFDANTPLTLRPPLNSNREFNLTVSAVSVDGSSTSAPASLPIHVSVKGIPDPVDLTTVTASYAEADLDSGSDRVMLSDMVSSAIKQDNDDGSETATFRVGGLAEGMVLRGGSLLIEGTGEERVWLLTEAQLATASIHVPANFSGTETLWIAPVTTEDDGNSTTWSVQTLQFTVIPSPEAAATVSAVLVEDTIRPINLQIVHNNDDDDETLTKLWIAVSDADSPGFDIYLGAVQLVAAGLDVESFGGVDYYVIEQGQIASLGAKGASNLDGTLGSFRYKYEITDSHFGTVPSGPAVAITKDGTFTLMAEPVTDAVDAVITSITGAGTVSGSDVELATAGLVTVNLNIVKLADAASDDNAPDIDGSEEVIRIVISGVPEGVSVVGADYVGPGTWILVYDGGVKPFNTAGGPPEAITFDVSGITSTAPTGDTITIEVQTQDRPDDPAFTTAIVADTVSWTLTTVFTGEGGEDPAIIKEWAYNGAGATEDTAFALSSVITADVTVQTPDSPNTFTITIKDVPLGTVIHGMTQTVVEGVLVWSKSVVVAPGQDANAAIQAMMDSIFITAPENSNENNASGAFRLDATLSTSVPGGDTEAATIDNQVIPVIPVTDRPEITIVAGTTGEGDTFMALSITVADPADGPAASIVDGKLYVKANATGSTSGLENGAMHDASGNPLATEVVGGVTYYVVTGVSSGDTVDLRYYPQVSKAGSISFTAMATAQEAGAANQEATSATLSSEFLVINNGVTATTTPSSGNENTLIEVTGIAVALIDDDGSETVQTIMLSNLPEGFLVFIGNDAASATQASNAGGSGTTNTWVISQDGVMPAYVGIMPPAYWSGTLDDLKLIVESGETVLDYSHMQMFDLSNITVEPVSNGVILDTSPTFGRENAIILFNLNAAMIDPTDRSVPGAPDANVETTTLKLTGLGAYASFYTGSTQIVSGISYNAGSDAYILTGLSQDDLDDLGFKQSRSALIDQDTGTPGLQIEIEAFTVDGPAAQSAAVTASVTVTSIAQAATLGADHLLWTGNAINAGAGTDTIELRYLEALSGDDLSSLLSNVEILEMHANSILNLDPADVLAITGAGSHVLTIAGGSGNAVELSSASQWSTTGVASGGVVTYTSIPMGVTLLINEIITVSYFV